MSRMTDRIARLAIAAFAISVAAPSRAESISSIDLYQKARDLGAPGLLATYRNKTLTIDGTFNNLLDTGIGKLVFVYFEHESDSSWKVSCAFDRDDIAQYDRFALMKRGTPISATGQFASVSDVFFTINFEPCQAQ